MNQEIEKKYDPVTKFFLFIVSPISQFIFILITSIAVTFMAYGPIKKYFSLEPAPRILPMTPQKVSEWGGEPTEVKVGLHIRNFPEFDFVKNEFSIDGIFWFEFDPALISLDTISKFSFEKAVLKRKSEAYTKIIKDKFFARYDIRLDFSMDLDYRFFPFDDHRMYITLLNRFVPPSEMMFESRKSYFSISDEINISGWAIDDKAVRTGYTEEKLEEYAPEKTVLYSKAVFSIDFKRLGVRYILLIILPFFIMFFTGLFSFAFDPETDEATIRNLAIGTITALLSYRFVLEAMTPKVGYFVLSDYIWIILLLFALIEFLVELALMKFGELTHFFIILRGSLFLSFHIIFFMTWYYFLHQLW